MQPVFHQLGIALALGLLVGLQREFAGKSMAGLRTFPLVTVFGTLTALVDLHLQSGGWIVAAGLLGVVSLAVVANMIALQQREADTPGPGVTTEAALLVMFAVGVLVTSGQYVVAVAVGAGVAVLLQFKPELHGIVDRLGEKDLRAIMQFAVISAIVLPLLPDKPIAAAQTVKLFGAEIAVPLDTFVPREVWWMVVLIVGISLGGYLAYKFFGQHAGILLGGVMGGAVSSTATTVSFSRRTAETPELTHVAAVVIMIASCIVYVRVLVEIAFVAPRHLAALAPPIVLILLVSVATAIALWLFWGRSDHQDLPEPKNPTELRSALMFAAMYALVLFLLAAVKQSEMFASSGLFVIAALSGLTDMDAITLSTARMVNGDDGGISTYDGWRLILLAGISNLVFKAGMVAALGSRRLVTWIIPLFAVPIAVSLLLIFLWPEAWAFGN